MIDYGKGVSLRRIDKIDLPLIRRWRNDNKIWKWCRQVDLIDEIHHEAWFERQSQDPAISMYKIVSGCNDMVGVCGLTSIDHLHQRAEFSLYTAPEKAGQGHGSLALMTLFSHGFEALNLNMIWGETFDGNPAAGLFEKMGMKREGTRRQFYWKGGRFIDCHLYSVLRSEWKL